MRRHVRSPSPDLIKVSSKVPSPTFHLKKPPFIIEMAENGILDYQGMNQAIYRGATSNIVVDTQSMSIEIGAGNSSHTSNLHIECDHDANVASIQLNSNVVTEFSRSKKLIKYPRVALTSAAATFQVIRIYRDGE